MASLENTSTSKSMLSMFSEVKAKVDLNTLRSIPKLAYLIETQKKENGLRLIETENGIEVHGTFLGLHKLEKAIQHHKPAASADIVIRYSKSSDVSIAERFFQGERWYFIERDASIQSSSNINLHSGEFAYLLLEKREQLREIFKSNKVSIRLKELNAEKMRLKIEKSTKSGTEVEESIKQMSKASASGMGCIDKTVKNLANPMMLCEILQNLPKPYLILLRKDKENGCWYINILILESQKKAATEMLDDALAQACDNPTDVKTTIADLCDETFVSKHSKKHCDHSTMNTFEDNHANQTFQDQSTQTTGSNKENLTYLDDREYQKDGGSTDRKHMASSLEVVKSKIHEDNENAEDTKEVFVIDEDVIDYMMKFRKSEMKAIEKEFGINIERKPNGVLLLKRNPLNLTDADLKVSHIAQNIYEYRTETIDLSTISEELYKQKLEEALKQATQMEFLVRIMADQQWFVLGRGEKLNECVHKVKVCFGLTKERKLLRSSNTSLALSVNQYSRQEKSNGLPPTEVIPPKAYFSGERDIWIFTWYTDITKLKVDIVVNAANESLSHGAGVAKAISMAAGRELEDASYQYVQNYGRLKVAHICITTAGKMPAKKVMHTVGPMWSSFVDKEKCKQKLCQTFYKCLDQAQANGYASIAFPAISSGIFGVPKEIVSEMAASSIAAFCAKYPFSKLKYIHLVDINMDSVRHFQDALNRFCRKGAFTEAKGYKSFSIWTASGTSNTSRNERPMKDATKRSDNWEGTHRRDVTMKIETNSSGASFSEDHFTDQTHQIRHGAQKESLGQMNSETQLKENETPPQLQGSSNREEPWHSLHDSRGINDSGSNVDDPGTDVDNPTKSIKALDATYAEALVRSKDLPQVHKNQQKHETKEPLKSESVDTKEEKEEDTCSICMEKPTNPKTLPDCKHTFCKDCIDECFDKMQPKCPNCGVIYGELRGTQPDNGTMTVSKDKTISLSGYPGCGLITIHYRFPDGVQTEKHPNPGKPYYGTRRTAYLPNNAEGNKVLVLLKRAFDARMVFTIGRSSTTGRDDNVIWNCIHHKTNIHGGPQGYGYPDKTYLSRVQEELAAQGFK